MKSKKISRGVTATVALLLPLGCALFAAASPSVLVEPITENIFKVSASLENELPQETVSQAVVMAPENVEGNSWISAQEYVISTPSTSVKVDRKTGNVSFFDAEGNMLIQEAEAINNDSAMKTIKFIMPQGDLFYGAGERGHSLTLNGDSLSFYNRQNYGYTEGDPRISQMGISVPWIVSDKGYGILIDDYNKAAIVLDDTITYSSQTSKPLSYYFINGSNMADAVSQYAKLTGNQPLPPLWSLGYITSKYGYHTQEETIGVIDTLKTRGYPVDGIVLDLYWYGKETDMGRLEWNPEQWPDHKSMLSTLKNQGVNTVLITQPYINKIGALDNYNLLSSKGLLAKDAEGKTHDVTTWVGEAGMFDMANPETREWLWSRLKSLTEEGVAGWWGDLGEPEVHPSTIVHANGESAQEFHNVYGNVWSKLIYDGLRKDFPEMRPLLMMRGGTTGLQRYGVMPWTTDVSRSWGGLQPQVKLMLSSGLSGLGYMSSDIGGFAVDPANPTDPELYVRWLQMGAFTPMLRTHAQLLPEPYHYPQYEDILKKYIKMRYEWLPYNYTLAYENAAFGYPLARPLNFRGDNPDAKYADVNDEYLWGDNVLVAPVMQQGATSRLVVFPAGVWIDFFNPAKTYAGGTEATVDAPLDKLPLFVRKGAFIPLFTGKVENVSDYNPADITVRYYPDSKETTYTLFDDNKLSPTSLKDGEYQLTVFKGALKDNNLCISVSNEGEGYPGMARYKKITLEVVETFKPAKIEVDGTVAPEVSGVDSVRNLGWYYDESNRTLSIVLPWVYEKMDITVFK